MSNYYLLMIGLLFFNSNSIVVQEEWQIRVVIRVLMTSLIHFRTFEEAIQTEAKIRGFNIMLCFVGRPISKTKLL